MRTGFNFLALLSILVTATSLIVLGSRAHEAGRLVTIPPGVQVTSGCEEESLHALWRQYHGQAVYVDPSQPPYAAAYFNWLFYKSYGWWVRPAVAGHGDAALISSGRHFTLLGVVFGTIALAGFGWRLTQGAGTAVRLAVLAIAVHATTGPLLGWWVVTVRPDVWALVLESAGLIGLLLLHRTRPVAAGLLAAVCFYLAWSFKQNYVQGFGIALVYLALGRHWKCCLLTGGVVGAGWAVTLMLGADLYRVALSSTATAGGFAISLGWQNLTDALIKCTPLVLLALPTVVVADSSGGVPSLTSDTRRLALIGLPLSLILSFTASCKMGAASNYYFTPMLLTTLLAMAGLSRLSSTFWLSLGMIAALALNLFLPISGRLSLQRQALVTEARWYLWKNAPGPRFADDQLLNLPWLNPGTPGYVMAFDYGSARARGDAFAHDGIGGLIRQRYFAALLLPVHVDQAYDRASLAGYTRGKSAAGVTLWLRDNQASNSDNLKTPTQ